MRPFRSRVLTALVTAMLCLGPLGTVAFAGDLGTSSVPSGPFPKVNVGIPHFPEDPWGLPSVGFPEDPWPGI
jgi:hypothetical protein